MLLDPSHARANFSRRQRTTIIIAVSAKSTTDTAKRTAHGSNFPPALALLEDSLSPLGALIFPSEVKVLLL
jgi:hypothetical protein